MFDHGPAATELARLVNGVRDDQLAAQTPCPAWAVSQLVEHVHEFATVFTLNARKEPVTGVHLAVDGELPADWRARVAGRLDSLVRAWAEPDAWTGRVSVGGIEMTREDNALVAVEELVVHGWDLARATGQMLEVDEDSLGRVESFLTELVPQFPSGPGPFGPTVAVPADASRLDRLLGTAGRDPRWSA